MRAKGFIHGTKHAWEIYIFKGMDGNGETINDLLHTIYNIIFRKRQMCANNEIVSDSIHLNSISGLLFLGSTYTNLHHQYVGSKIIADKFNEYFTEIGPKLARSMLLTYKVPFNSYFTNPCAASFNFAYTNRDDIAKIIRYLRPKSSVGHDNISTKLLKEIEHIVSRPLSIIINQSLCTGIFPDKLTIGKVIPLFKKDDNKSIGNYRAISLLSSISKIFERVAFNQLYHYLTSNGKLYESQYGFRKYHSTALAA